MQIISQQTAQKALTWLMLKTAWKHFVEQQEPSPASTWLWFWCLMSQFLPPQLSSLLWHSVQVLQQDLLYCTRQVKSVVRLQMRIQPTLTAIAVFFLFFFFKKPGRVEPLSCVFCDPFLSSKVTICSDVMHSLTLSQPQRDDFAHFSRWWAPRPWRSRRNNFLLSMTPLSGPWADGSGGCGGHTPAASPESTADHRRIGGGGTCADKVKRARELVLRRQHRVDRVSRGGCSPGLQTPVSDTATIEKKRLAVEFSRIIQEKLVPRHHVTSQKWWRMWRGGNAAAMETEQLAGGVKK